MPKEKFFILSATRYAYLLARISGFAPYYLPYEEALETEPYINFSHLVQFMVFLCIYVPVSAKSASITISEKMNIVNTTYRFFSYCSSGCVVAFIVFHMFNFKNWWHFCLEIVRKETEVY